MMSYAQQGEDVVLRRAFAGLTDGFYVDVGAAWPVVDSVTKYFYEKGWRGINIEPNPQVFAELVVDRPQDINLQVAIAPEAGEVTLSVFPRVEGWSTTTDEIRQRHEALGLETKAVQVPAKPLNDILVEHAASKRIAFIKIDVEGAERGVLESLDLKRWKPGVLVVEATEPGSPEPSHADWEPIIIGQGYKLAQFDGLNRWYALDAALLEAASLPPNSFDEYIPYKWWQLIPRAEQQKVIDRLQTKYGCSVDFPLNTV